MITPKHITLISFLFRLYFGLHLILFGSSIKTNCSEIRRFFSFVLCNYFTHKKLGWVENRILGFSDTEYNVQSKSVDEEG